MADDLETQPIFARTEQECGRLLLEAEYRLEAIAADPRVAKALTIATGSPIFLHSALPTRDHHPVDDERPYYRGDHIRFVTRPAQFLSNLWPRHVSAFGATDLDHASWEEDFERLF